MAPKKFFVEPDSGSNPHWRSDFLHCRELPFAVIIAGRYWRALDGFA
jgi:hypothetical protein